jgi:phosphopantothenate-cysteine ligase
MTSNTTLNGLERRPDSYRYGSFSFANEEEDPYFTTHTKPEGLEIVKACADEFITYQKRKGRPVVLVTSGGSTVPLEVCVHMVFTNENQTVRFIDNFSAGTRGACSAEYFIENGYAVIFLHRKFSLLPYSRHYSHTTNCFLDFMVERNGRVEGISPLNF